RLARRADGAHLRAERGSRLEHGRSVHRAAAAQGRRVGDRNGARPRLPDRRRRVTAPASLRARLIRGAIAWTVGLFVVTGVVLNFALIRHPSSPRLLHSFFDHWIISSIIAAAAMWWGIWEVRRGVSPLQQLRAKLSGVRAGDQRAVTGDYPGEVQPLVDDLN